MSKLIFVSFFFLINIIQSSTVIYTPSDIIDNIKQKMNINKKKDLYPLILDMNNLMDAIDYEILEKFQKLILKKSKLNTIIVFISNIQQFQGGINAFADLCFYELQKFIDLNKVNLVFTLFSVGDRQMVMKTTNNIMNVFPPQYAYDLLERRKNALQGNHFFLTAYELLKDIYKDFTNYKKTGKISDL